MSAAVPAPLLAARKEALAARQIVEELLLALPELPRAVDREPLAAALERARGGLAEWSETGVDHPELHARLQAVIEALAEARAQLGAIEGSPSATRSRSSLQALEPALGRCKELALDAIVETQDRLARAPAAIEAAPARPFRASVGVPALQRLSRAPLPGLLAPEAPDDDDDDDDAPAARVARRLPAPEGDPGELEQIRRLARDAIEGLGVFENLRRRNPDEPWPEAARFEQRLLDNLDALLSLEVVEHGASRRPGAVLQAIREATDASFPDPGRGFAATFALGSLEGEDAVDAVLLAVRQADPETLAAHETALVLAPSPAIAGGVRRLLRQADPRLLRLALAVLFERREARFADAALLLGHEDPDVAGAAARALGVVPERAAAVAALEAAVLEDPDETVVAAIAESLLLLGSPRGLDLARERLREEIEAAPSMGPSELVPRLSRLIGLSGRLDDAPLLLAAFEVAPADPSPLGWLGHVDAIPPLLAALVRESARGEQTGTYEDALVEALHRITGAPTLSPPVLGVSSASDAHAFAAWWRENGARLPPSVRHRFGKPWSAWQSLEELERDTAAIEARAAAAVELAMALPGAPLFRTSDWVARQRTALAELRARLGG